MVSWDSPTHLVAGCWSRFRVIERHQIFYGLLFAPSGNCARYNWVNTAVQGRLCAKESSACTFRSPWQFIDDWVHSRKYERYFTLLSATTLRLISVPKYNQTLQVISPIDTLFVGMLSCNVWSSCRMCTLVIRQQVNSLVLHRTCCCIPVCRMHFPSLLLPLVLFETKLCLCWPLSLSPRQNTYFIMNKWCIAA